MDYEVAKASRDQMPGVAGVFTASRLHALPYLPKLHTPAEDIEYLTNVVFPQNDIRVARQRDSSEILGFIAFTPEWVNHLYLLPQARRNGIGRRLLSLAKEHALTLDLWTFQRNSAARQFYERNGFKVVRRTDGSENEEREPDVQLRWIASST
jgi:putative acetyltransferase